MPWREGAPPVTRFDIRVALADPFDALDKRRFPDEKEPAGLRPPTVEVNEPAGLRPATPIGNEKEPTGLRPLTGVTGSVDPQTPAFLDADAAAAECHDGAVGGDADVAPSVLAENIFYKGCGI